MKQYNIVLTDSQAETMASLIEILLDDMDNFEYKDKEFYQTLWSVFANRLGTDVMGEEV